MNLRRALRLFTAVAISALAIPAVAQAAPSPIARQAYIVQFTKQTDSAGKGRELRAKGIPVKYTYSNTINGAAVQLSPSELSSLSSNPDVLSIVADTPVTASALTTQTSATWGLDRVDQASKISTVTGYVPTYTYTYDGTGVTAYVVDTGVLSTHTQFGARVSASGFSAISDGRGTTDCNGHGTHVSGTIGGSTYGVAKNVTIVPVRVLDCAGSGTTSGVIAGLDWINSQQADWAGTDFAPTATPNRAVVNMSLGGGANNALDAAVARLVQSGVTVVVAAGNSTTNACNSSPSRAPEAITVAASTSSDTLASYSNYGSCVDIIAPGSGVTSSWINSTSCTNTCISTISGTSMATPHVTGVVALLLQEEGVKAPATIADIINTASTKIAFATLPNGTKNAILNSSPSGYTGAIRYRAAPATNLVQTALSKSVKLTWTPSANNGGTSITSQTVEVWSNGALVKTVTGLTPSSTTSTVSGLSSTTTYTFRVGTVNAVGTSYTAMTGAVRALR